MASNVKPKRSRKRSNKKYDPSLREVFEIILERYELTLDDKLSTLKENQPALRSIIEVFDLAVES